MYWISKTQCYFFNHTRSSEPDGKRSEEACCGTQSRRQGHLRGLPPHYAGKGTFQRLYLFMYSRPKPICLFKAICSRRSTDTSDDFIEGLRHFDKVIVSIKHFTWVMKCRMAMGSSALPSSVTCWPPLERSWVMRRQSSCWLDMRTTRSLFNLFSILCPFQSALHSTRPSN